MDITVSKLRLSYIWTETLGAQIAAAGDKAPMAFLRGRGSYEKEFEAALDSPAAGRPHLTPPWRKDSPQRYWTYYAEKTPSDKIRPQQVWKLLIPLRVPGPLIDASPPANVRLTQEGFLFPFGMALVLGVHLEQDLPLDKAVDCMISIRYDPVFAPSAGGAKFTLSALADRGLAAVREAALGDGVASGTRSLEPFSVASIVEATGEGVLMPVASHPALHRALDGLARLSHTWRVDAVTSLAKGLLSHESGRPAEHCTLAARHGRSVWQPHYFTDNLAARTSLSCYHRNLMFASLQVQSLLGLIAYAGKLSDDGNVAAGSIEDCIRSAAGLIGRIFGGDPTTYRTGSARRQIVDSSMGAVINRVRGARGMRPLTV